MLCAGIGAGQPAFAGNDIPAEAFCRPDSGKVLRFDRTVIDAGTLTEDDAPRTYRFVCTNVSGDAVTIRRVQTTCGCTAATVSKERLLPADTCTVAVTYTPKNHPGTIDADAFVYLSTSDQRPEARLRLTGKVLPGADEWARYPYAMGVLRLKQNRVKMDGVTPDMEPSARILCGNSGTRPLRISSLLLPPYAKLHTEPEVIAPGAEADLVITLYPKRIPAGTKASFSFPVVLEGVDARPSDRTVQVEVHCVK